jgi:hypothetical protein
MKIEIIKGAPTPDEVAIIEAAMIDHTRRALRPVVVQSIYSLPILRKPLPHLIAYGTKRFQ